MILSAPKLRGSSACSMICAEREDPRMELTFDEANEPGTGLVGNLSPRVHRVGKAAERAPASPSESDQVRRTPDGHGVLPSPRRRLNERTDLTPPAENREPRRDGQPGCACSRLLLG